MTATSPHIALVTLLWQRPHISGPVLNWYALLDVTRLAVGSEGTHSQQLAEAADWGYVEYPNTYLTKKWTAGVEALKEDSWDALVIIGSNNLLSWPYFQLLKDVIPEYDAALWHTQYYYDTATGQLWNATDLDGIGSGVMLRRDLLERCEWQPWGTRPHQQPDRHLHTALKQHAEHPYHIREMDVVAQVNLKSDTNIWSFGNIVGRTDGQYIDPAPIFATHFPGWEMSQHTRRNYVATG